MADNKKVLLEIDLDEKNLEKALGKVKAELKATRAEQNALLKAMELLSEGSSQYEDLAQQVGSAVSSITDLTREQSELNKQLDFAKSAATSYNAIASEAAVLEKRLKAMPIDETNQGYVDMRDRLDLLNKEKLKFSQNVSDLHGQIGSYDEAIKNNINTITGLEQALADLEAKNRNLDVNTDEFKNNSLSIDEFKTKLQQLRGEIDEFGNREPKNNIKKQIDDVAEVTGAAISSLTLLNVVSGDNADIAEVQAKAIQGVAIAQNVRNVVLGASKAVDVAKLARDKALTAATWIKTLATKGATIAQTGFNIAIAIGLGPLLLVVGAVVALAAGFYLMVTRSTQVVSGVKSIVSGFLSFVGMLQPFTKALDAVIGAFQPLLDYGRRFLELINVIDTEEEKTHKNAVKRAEERYNDLERQKGAHERLLEIKKAEGAKEAEIRALSIKGMRDQLQVYQDLINAGISLSEEQRKQFEDLIQNIKVFQAESKKIQADADDKAKKEADDKAKKSQEERSKAVIKARQDLADAEIRILYDLREREIQAERLALKRKLDEISGSSSEEIRLREVLTQESRKRIQEIEDKFSKASQDKRNKEILDQLTNELNARREGSQAALDTVLQIQEEQMRQELQNTELTEAGKKVIRDKYRDLRIQATQEHNRKILQHSLQAQADQITAEQNFARLRGESTLEAEKILAGIRRSVALESLDDSIQIEAQKRDLLLEQETLTDQERLKIQQEYDQRILELQASQKEKRLLIESEYEAQINDIREKAVDDELANMEKRAQISQTIGGVLTDMMSLFTDNQKSLAQYAKMIGLFQIAVDTGVAISGIVAANAKTSLTPLDYALKVASGIGMVFANIAKAKKLLTQDPPSAPGIKKFDHGGLAYEGGYIPTFGGMITGRSHQEGGVRFSMGGKSIGEADGKKGEAYVINTRKDPRLRALASAVNVAGGGRSFFNFGGGFNLTSGTLIPPGITQSSDSRRILVEDLASAVAMIPPGVVEVHEIIDVTDRVVSVKDRASI